MGRSTGSFVTAAGLAALALAAGTLTFAQTGATRNTYITLRLTPAHRAMAGTAQTVHRKLKPVLSTQPPDALVSQSLAAQSAANRAQTGRTDFDFGALRYPADVVDTGGPTVASAQSHAIFMQPEGNACAISACWGDPEGLLTDLGRSDFIHVAD